MYIILIFSRPQFSQQDSVFHAVKVHGGFVIICTITSSPSTPLPPPSGPRQFVPKGLLNTVGSLLDDPTYPDVEFMIPRHGAKNEECEKNIGLPATIEKSGVL